MSAEMTVHTQVGRIKTFSVKSSQYDSRWCEMATRPQPTYFLPAGFMRVSCSLYGPRAGVLRWHRRENTRRLLGQSFEHAQNLSAGKSDLRAHLRESQCEIRANYWQASALCGDLRAAKFVPSSLPTRLARKSVTEALRQCLDLLVTSGAFPVHILTISSNISHI